MDGVGTAASVISIATAGIQISIKLITLATQISTASERISSIGNDVSLTSGVLQQLGELMTQKAAEDDIGIRIFSQGGLETTKSSASMCQTIFEEIDKATKTASEQLRNKGRFTGGKIKLSRIEKAKWPFLQPSIETLRIDLREAKGTLMLMLQVTTLAFSKRMAELNESGLSKINEQRDMVYAILAIQKEQKGATDNSNRERRQSSSQNVQNALPTARGVQSTSALASENETMFYSILAKYPNLQDSFKPSLMMRAPSQELDLQKVVESNQDYKPPTHEDQCDQCSNFNTEQTISRSLTTGYLPTLSGSASEVSLYGLTSNTSIHLPPTDSSTAGPTAASYNHKVEEMMLELFLLKPIIKDFFAVIQLSWSLRNVQISQGEIRNQLARNEQENIPAVWEVMESLYPHEHKVIDEEVSTAGPGASLASLKRTKADIQHREIMFQGVPGLHFVIQRQDGPTAASGAASEKKPMDAPSKVRTQAEHDQAVSESTLLDPDEEEHVPSAEEEAAGAAEESAERAAKEAEERVFSKLTRVSDLAMSSDFSRGAETFSDMAMESDMARSAELDSQIAGEMDSNSRSPHRRSSISNHVSTLDAADSGEEDYPNDRTQTASTKRGFRSRTSHSKPGDQLPRTKIDREEPFEGASEGLATLKDKIVNQAGNLVDEHGTVYGRVLQWDSGLESAERRTTLIGRYADERGDIRSETGEIIGIAELISRVRESPFARFEHPIVKGDFIIDSNNNIVGRVLGSVDPVELVGSKVNELGDVLDGSGVIIAKAERYQPECYLDSFTTEAEYVDPCEPRDGWNLPGSVSSRLGGEQNDLLEQQQPEKVGKGGNVTEDDHDSNVKPNMEVFKSSRSSKNDPLHRVLPAYLKTTGIEGDWHEYSLFIIHEGQERRVGPNERPIVLFNALNRRGRNPMFVLRRNTASAEHGSQKANNLSEQRDNNPFKNLPVAPTNVRDRRFVLASSVPRVHWALGLLDAEEDLQPPGFAGSWADEEEHSTGPLCVAGTSQSYDAAESFALEDSNEEDEESDFVDDHNDADEKNEMADVVIDLLGKYTTLFEPHEKSTSKMNLQLPGGVL